MKKGFTLIELLVVITILAVLAGAALPYVQNYVEESRVAKAKADLEEISKALAVYETREGDYTKPDVSDLTGRYLNKSPIDPWGAAYIVDPLSGTVYSTGPDRKDDTEGKYDNIFVPYQPPLALVSIKWVDKNQSGRVDFQNVSDELHLSFSRKLGNDLAQIQGFTGVINITTDNANTSLLSAIADGPAAKVVASKVVIYPIALDDAFVSGRDYVTIQAGHNTIFDISTPNPNFSLSSQDVKILPQ